MKDTVYYCDFCKSTRTISIDEIEHEKEVEISPNGLRLQSDIHRCASGQLGVNNLYVDIHYTVRSFGQLKLPTSKQKQQTRVARPGIPSPRAKSSHLRKLMITGVTPGGGFRFILNDEWLDISLNIGKIDPDEELAISVISSDLGGITLVYYPGEIDFSPNVEMWLTSLVNAMETMLPSRLSLIIEAIWYIIDLYENEPIDFDKRMIKSILASHEIYFKIIDPNILDNLAVTLSSKYREKDLSMMLKIVGQIELNPDKSLLEYTGNLHHDLLYLLYLFLIMENENLIDIYRPGILDI